MIEKNPFTQTNSAKKDLFLRIDLHGQNRWKARKTLFRLMIRLLSQKKVFLLIIHGYRHGTVLRDYIRSGRFARDLAWRYPQLPGIVVVVAHDGATKIYFEGGVCA